MSTGAPNNVITPAMIQWMMSFTRMMWRPVLGKVMSDRRWKEQVNLYTKIQGLCDRPAYFWYNYRITEFASAGVVLSEGYSISIVEAIDSCWSTVLEHELSRGIIDPQAFCDAQTQFSVV